MVQPHILFTYASNVTRRVHAVACFSVSFKTIHCHIHPQILPPHDVCLFAGYHAPDFQVAALLADQAKTLKLSYAHNLTATSTVGTEITRKLATSDTTFALAYARKLSNGALTKFKVDGSGLLSVLYETKLATGEKIAGSVQLQATDLSKPVKYGFAVDLS